MTDKETKQHTPAWVGLLRFAIFLVVLVFVVALGSLSWWYAIDFVMPSQSTSASAPADFGLTAQEIELTTSDDVTLIAWYVPPPDGSDDALVYLHGLGSNRGHMLEHAAALHEVGYGALLLDARGHGESEAVYRTMGVQEVEDVQAAVTFLQSQPQVAQIGVMGISFGASTGLIASAQIDAVETVVAFSPYSSLVDVVGDRAWRMFRLAPRPTADLVLWWMTAYTGENIYRASPEAAVAAIDSRPVLHVHGTRDGIIPYAASERIMGVAGDNVTHWTLEGVGHGTESYALQTRWDDVIAFLDATMKPATSS